MLLPNPRRLGPAARYAAAAQQQAFRFLATGLIDDTDPILDQILPP
jgi:hypothetical protein